MLALLCLKMNNGQHPNNGSLFSFSLFKITTTTMITPFVQIKAQWFFVRAFLQHQNFFSDIR
jgi:hypothetical protein